MRHDHDATLRRLAEITAQKPNWESFSDDEVSLTAVQTALGLVIAVALAVDEGDERAVWPAAVLATQEGSLRLIWEGPAEQIELGVDALGSIGIHHAGQQDVELGEELEQLMEHEAAELALRVIRS